MGFGNQMYVIHFDSASIEFPKRCPVCGELATTKATIGASVRETVQPPSYKARSSRRYRQPTSFVVRRIEIPVCEEHYYSLNEQSRVKSICSVTIGILLMILLFSTAISFFFYIDGIIFNSSIYLLIVFDFLLIVLGLRFIGPSKLEKSIRIARMNFGGQSITLKVKDKWYAKELLRLNDANARPMGIGGIFSGM